MPLVPGLGAALALTGPTLEPVEFAWTIRGRRLGRIVRIQVDALFKQSNPLNQQFDDSVTFRNGLGQLYLRQIRRLDSVPGCSSALHGRSMAIKS